MTFDFGRFLPAAEDFARNPDEGYVRSAISRAYYSGYMTAALHLLALGYPLRRSGDSHYRVWEIFRDADIPRWRIVGLVGQSLHRWRLRADYQETVNITQVNANGVVRDARRILPEIPQFTIPPP